MPTHTCEHKLYDYISICQDTHVNTSNMKALPYDNTHTHTHTYTHTHKHTHAEKSIYLVLKAFVYNGITLALWR